MPWKYKTPDEIVKEARSRHPDDEARAMSWAFGGLTTHYEMALAEIEQLESAPCRHDRERSEVDEREGVER